MSLHYYLFGKEIKILDGNIINEWLSVDENLEVVISKKAVMGDILLEEAYIR